VEALECILTRRSTGRLTGPGPDAAAVRRLAEAATAAPDHGLLRPWRFVVVRGEARVVLGEAFARAQAGAEPDAPEAALEATRGKPLRAPLIVTVVASPQPSPKIPEWEQHASAAAAAQNLCLAAHALGYAAMWRTGWFAHAPEVRAQLGLDEHESVTAWVYLGTPVEGWQAPPRPEIELEARITELSA
jgi:nitroreductase